LQNEKVYFVIKLKELGIKISQFGIPMFLGVGHKGDFNPLSAVCEEESFGSGPLLESVLPRGFEIDGIDQHQARILVKFS
jgi:hypothetical protein